MHAQGRAACRTVTEELMVGCGMVWGALAVLGFIALKRRFGCGSRWAYGGYGGYGPGCGGGGHRGGWDDDVGPGFSRRGFRGFGLRAVLRGAFERLGTTPGQEKVIVAALEELREAMSHAKDEIKGSRKDFADAFRGGPIDEASVADIFVRHDTVISETRRKVVEAVGKIHEALDEEQRTHVADLIEKGLGHGWHGRGRHGYRG